MTDRVTPTVSIIVPVLNEATALPATLRHLTHLSPPPVDVVVVDGGSSDGTPAIARAAGATVVTAAPPPSRARQMNQGARVARGDILVFLHADTWLPPDALAVVARALDEPATAGVGFVSIMTGPGRTRWLTSLHNLVKTIYGPLFFRPFAFWRRGLRLIFGDQALSCRRCDFFQCGGYDEACEVMEDAWLCESLNRMGRIRLLDRVVLSSDRRVAQWGFWGSHARYLFLAAHWGLGRKPGAWARRLYGDIRSDQRTIER